VRERFAGVGVDGGEGWVCEEEGENLGALGMLDGLGKDGGGRTTWPVLPARTAVVMVGGLLCD